MSETARMDRIEKALDTLVPLVATLAANQMTQQDALKTHASDIKELHGKTNKISLVIAALIATGGVAVKATAANLSKLWS